MSTEEALRDELYLWLKPWPQVGTTKWKTARELLEKTRAVGKLLTYANPMEPSIGNVVRRVLFVIREAYHNRVRAVKTEEPTSDPSLSESMHPSLQTLLGPSEDTDYSVPVKDLRPLVMEGMAEVVEDIEDYLQPICDQALEFIHASEIILTYGGSATVEAFLKAAAKKRNFKVIVAEGAPRFRGHEMARSLALSGIDCTVINDSAVFAMMARVNKVIIGTKAVMANGGLIAEAGINMVGMAAKQYSVPLVCVTGIFKLTPLYPHDCEIFNSLYAPSEVIPFDQLDHILQKVDVMNPAYDYVPPELVDLFIANVDCHQPSPSYIYRLLSELYNQLDYVL